MATDSIKLPIVKGTTYSDLFADATDYLWRVALLVTRRPTGWEEQLRSARLVVPACDLIPTRVEFVSDIDLADVARGIIPNDKCTHVIWQVADGWTGQAFAEVCRAPATSAVSASELVAIVAHAGSAFVAEHGGTGGLIEMDRGHIDGGIRLLAFSFVDRLVWELSAAAAAAETATSMLQLQLPPVIV